MWQSEPRNAIGCRKVLRLAACTRRLVEKSKGMKQWSGEWNPRLPNQPLNRYPDETVKLPAPAHAGGKRTNRQTDEQTDVAQTSVCDQNLSDCQRRACDDFRK